MANAGFDSGKFIGRNSGSSIGGPPSEFTGTIFQVTVNLTGKLVDPVRQWAA